MTDKMKKKQLKDEKVETLLKIWERIPVAATEQIDISQKELISHYLDTFQPGPSFYIIFNTRTANMEYVSPEVASVLSYLPDEFALPVLMEGVHPEDIPYYYHYEQCAVRFFSGLSPELFFKYKFSYDYRMLTGKGEYKRILQQVIPAYYFPEGGARTIGIFTDIEHLNVQGTPKLSFIGMQGAPSYYNVYKEEEFSPCKKLFTRGEQEILKYMIQGKSSKHIAETLCRSLHTVSTHRKNILRKSDCDTVNELLVKAVREGWI